jgi:hypothetical protein
VYVAAFSLLFAAGPLLAAPPKPAKPAPPPAPAPPPPPPAPPPVPSLAETLTGDAKADYETARLAFGDHDYAGALIKFGSAYEKSKDPRLLWNMATCEKQLRHYSKVIGLVKRYMAEGGDKLEESDRKEASELVAALEPLTAKLTIQVSEPGAEVFVDDERVGTSPLDAPVQVDVGSRKIRIVKADFVEVNQTAVIGGDQGAKVDVKLAAVTHEGRLVITASPDATIFVDGKPVGHADFAGPVKSGPHAVRVTADNAKPYEADVNVADKETRSLSINLEHLKTGPSPWIFVGVGAGVVVAAALVVGGYFLFKPVDKVLTGTLEPGYVQAGFHFF